VLCAVLSAYPSPACLSIKKLGAFLSHSDHKKIPSFIATKTVEILGNIPGNKRTQNIHIHIFNQDFTSIRHPCFSMQGERWWC